MAYLLPIHSALSEGIQRNCVIWVGAAVFVPDWPSNKTGWSIRDVVVSDPLSEVAY